jgi:hypothetical protein
VPSVDSTKIAETIPFGRYNCGRFVIRAGGKLSPKGGTRLNPAKATVISAVIITSKQASIIIFVRPTFRLFFISFSFNTSFETALRSIGSKGW